MTLMECLTYGMFGLVYDAWQEQGLVEGRRGVIGIRPQRRRRH